MLEVVFEELPKITWRRFRNRPFRLWRYRELIPLPNDAEIVSLNEGGTPLIPLTHISHRLGVKVYGKFEGANPSSSFKDRGMTVAVSMAKYLGEKLVVCASTGNTAASMAAYASRAGLKPLVVLPRKGVAKGKLAQAIIHGAVIMSLNGLFDDALKIVLELARRRLAYPLNSFNPWRIEGQKTVSYEIMDELGGVDWIIVPVGNAGNITAIWKGLKELKELGLIEDCPKLVGIQASGAAPLVKVFKERFHDLIPVEEPKTIASAIRIGKPIHWRRALEAIYESNGLLVEVDDEEILRAQENLARWEGLSVEPASATTVAGLFKLVEGGVIGQGEKVVVILTGHGLKDQESMLLHSTKVFEVSSVDDAINIVKNSVHEW